MDQRKFKNLRVTCGMAGAIMWLSAAQGLYAQRIVNYENDPNLREAKQFDQTSGAPIEKASRELAVKAYLKYLETSTNKDVRARVYFTLGGLYSGGALVKKGEARDDALARSYYEKGLAERPDAVSFIHVGIKLTLAAGIKEEAERIKKMMDVYEEIVSLQGDIPEERISPENGPGPEGVADEKERLMGAVGEKGIFTQYVQSGIVRDVQRSSLKEAYARKLIERFPRDKIAERAKQLLANEEGVGEKVNEINPFVPKTPPSNVLPPSKPIAPAKLSAGNIFPFNEGEERRRFLRDSGMNSEPDEKEFDASAKKTQGFVRSFDRWKELSQFDKNGNTTVDWFEARSYREAVAAVVIEQFDKDRNKKLTGDELKAANDAIKNGLELKSIPSPTSDPK